MTPLLLKSLLPPHIMLIFLLPVDLDAWLGTYGCFSLFVFLLKGGIGSSSTWLVGSWLGTTSFMMRNSWRKWSWCLIRILVLSMLLTFSSSSFLFRLVGNYWHWIILATFFLVSIWQTSPTSNSPCNTHFHGWEFAIFLNCTSHSFGCMPTMHSPSHGRPRLNVRCFFPRDCSHWLVVCWLSKSGGIFLWWNSHWCTLHGHDGYS